MTETISPVNRENQTKPPPAETKNVGDHVTETRNRMRALAQKTINQVSTFAQSAQKAVTPTLRGSIDEISKQFNQNMDEMKRRWAVRAELRATKDSISAFSTEQSTQILNGMFGTPMENTNQKLSIQNIIGGQFFNSHYAEGFNVITFDDEDLPANNRHDESRTFLANTKQGDNKYYVTVLHKGNKLSEVSIMPSREEKEAFDKGKADINLTLHFNPNGSFSFASVYNGESRSRIPDGYESLVAHYLQNLTFDAEGTKKLSAEEITQKVTQREREEKQEKMQRMIAAIEDSGGTIEHVEDEKGSGITITLPDGTKYSTKSIGGRAATRSELIESILEHNPNVTQFAEEKAQTTDITMAH